MQSYLSRIQIEAPSTSTSFSNDFALFVFPSASAAIGSLFPCPSSGAPLAQGQRREALRASYSRNHINETWTRPSSGK